MISLLPLQLHCLFNNVSLTKIDIYYIKLLRFAEDNAFNGSLPFVIVIFRVVTYSICISNAIFINDIVIDLILRTFGLSIKKRCKDILKHDLHYYWR